MTPDDPGHPHELLSALLDGELTAPEREAVDRHLAGCPACRDLLEDLRHLAAASSADPVPQVPADLESRIRGRIDKARRPADAGANGASTGYGPGYRSFWLSPLPLGAAASLLVAVIAVAIWQANRSLEPISPAPPPAGEPTASLPAPDRESIQNVPSPELERDAEGPVFYRARVADRPTLQEEKVMERPSLPGEPGMIQPTPAQEPILKAPAPPGVPASSVLPTAPAPRPYQVVDQGLRAKGVNEEGPDAGAAGSMTAAGITGPRSVTLATDLYRAVVTEDGGVILTSGPSYVCVIPPPDPEIPEGIRVARQTASPAAELRQLFEQAYAARPAATGAQGVAAGVPGPVPDSGAPAAAAKDIDDRIDRLIRTHYLPRAESLCGPLPAPQAAPATPAPRE